MAQLPSPERFEVEIHGRSGSDDGSAVTYAVVTWLHAYKAVALAVEKYRRDHRDSPVYDVIVTPFGPVARNEDGTTALAPRDLVDRWEF